MSIYGMKSIHISDIRHRDTNLWTLIDKYKSVITRVVTHAYFLYECIDFCWLLIRLIFYVDFTQIFAKNIFQVRRCTITDCRCHFFCRNLSEDTLFLALHSRKIEACTNSVQHSDIQGISWNHLFSWNIRRVLSKGYERRPTHGYNSKNMAVKIF